MDKKKIFCWVSVIFLLLSFVSESALSSGSLKISNTLEFQHTYYSFFSRTESEINSLVRDLGGKSEPISSSEEEEEEKGESLREAVVSNIYIRLKAKQLELTGLPAASFLDLRVLNNGGVIRNKVKLFSLNREMVDVADFKSPVQKMLKNMVCTYDTQPYLSGELNTAEVIRTFKCGFFISGNSKL